MNEPLFLTIGASNVNREEMSPKPPDAPNFLLFPSRIFTSTTEDARPPYSAGIPDLYKDTSFIASELNTEKNPRRCEAL